MSSNDVIIQINDSFQQHARLSHKSGLYRIQGRRNKAEIKREMYSKEEVRVCPTRKGCYFVNGHTWEVSVAFFGATGRQQ